MVYKGFCDKQSKNFSVTIDEVDASTTEDLKGRKVNGILRCKYARITGCCLSPSECSIVKDRIN